MRGLNPSDLYSDEVLLALPQSNLSLTYPNLTLDQRENTYFIREIRIKTCDVIKSTMFIEILFDYLVSMKRFSVIYHAFYV